jgi:hypothetical protein
MALQVSDLQTQLAYRIGETTTPNDSTTKALRLEWLNQGYFTIARRRNWWWLEGTDTSNTNTGSTSGYSEPTDLKQFIELKIDDTYYDQIPYKQNRNFTGTGAIVTLPTLRRSFKFYRYGGKYYLIPTDGAGGETHNIKYYKRVTKRSSDSDTFLMPDEYLEAVVAFAEGRYWMSITQQAKSVVPFQEFEEIVKEMEREQSRRSSGAPGFGIRDPEDGFPDE